MEILDKILPSWKEYPEAETLPLKSHTNQSLKVVDAKVLPIKIPGTDISFLAPVQIEKGSQEMVIGRDIIISQKMGLKWEGEEKLFVTVPSAINPSHTWKIEVFRADLQLNTVRNVDEIHLEAGGEVAVRMHGTGGEKLIGDVIVKSVRNSCLQQQVVMLDTYTKCRKIGDHELRVEVVIKNTSKEDVNIMQEELVATMNTIENDCDFISLEQIVNETDEGRLFEHYLSNLGGQCDIQRIDTGELMGEDEAVINDTLDEAEIEAVSYTHLTLPTTPYV